VSDSCGSAAERVTSFLGFSCEDADPVITLRNPADLSSWTQPVLEVLIIAGAVLALVHAVRRLRNDGDPTNLALWFGSLVYLLVTEPPLYFPEWFGLDNAVGFIFAHNVFTVQFMFDRLPLYIVAFYPAMSALAYEIVRATRVFATRGPLVGAVCVALVYQAFYEIFDQLGPQLRWWAWNLDNDVNHPLMDSVPVNSVWIFATVSFGVLTYLAVRLVGVPTSRGRAPRGASLIWRIVAIGALAPVGMMIASIPTGVFGGDDPNVKAQAIVMTVELVAIWLYGGAVLIRQWRQPAGADRASSFLRVFPAAYLLVFLALWASALREFFAAEDGVTDAGTPVGNLPYVVLCFALATTSLYFSLPRSRVAGAATVGRSAATKG